MRYLILAILAALALLAPTPAAASDDWCIQSASAITSRRGTTYVTSTSCRVPAVAPSYYVPAPLAGSEVPVQDADRLPPPPPRPGLWDAAR